jgi:hypothetical protein
MEESLTEHKHHRRDEPPDTYEKGRLSTGPKGVSSAPRKPRQDIRSATDCSRHETAEGYLRPMSGIERQ